MIPAPSANADLGRGARGRAARSATRSRISHVPDPEEQCAAANLGPMLSTRTDMGQQRRHQLLPPKEDEHAAREVDDEDTDCEGSQRRAR
jgi:hypothetical protein